MHGSPSGYATGGARLPVNSEEALGIWLNAAAAGWDSLSIVMDKSVGLYAGCLVETYAARTERGWTGVGHVVRAGRVVDRVSTPAVATEALALAQADARARQRALEPVVYDLSQIRATQE